VQPSRIAFVGVEMQLKSIFGRDSHDDVAEYHPAMVGNNGDGYRILVL
jgi:hypothetical protein